MNKIRRLFMDRWMCGSLIFVCLQFAVGIQHLNVLLLRLNYSLFIASAKFFKFIQVDMTYDFFLHFMTFFIFLTSKQIKI